jgi:glycosylphosphatidylinositol transamidase (GPIT) subunit GPI8
MYAYCFHYRYTTSIEFASAISLIAKPKPIEFTFEDFFQNVQNANFKLLMNLYCL